MKPVVQLDRTGCGIASVAALAGVSYQRIDERGLWIRARDGASRCLEVDTVVNCSGQLSNAALAGPLRTRGVEVHVVGPGRRG